MSNPQENLGTPPPPSPSNSYSSTPPSVSPKPRLQRVKMLARKTVAFGALRKALNERLKASQVKESQAPNFDSISKSESYQSTTEGEGHGSSDSEKIQESPSEVSSSVIENLETRFVLVGPIRDVEVPEKRRSGERVEESGMKSSGSGSGEAAEELVYLSTRRDEPVSSTEKTLADLLKKVGASYDPKKRRTPTTKAPNIPKPSKKIKASPPTPTASSLSREEENDFEKEQDKLAIFGRRKILKGGLLKDLVEPGVMRLVDALAAQGWKDMVLQMDGRLARNELIEFMANVAFKDGVVSSLVKGVQLQLDAEKLGEILDIPSEGFDDYTRQRWLCLDSLPTSLEITKRFSDSKEMTEVRAVQKSEMRPEHKVVFEFLNKCLLPRQERRHTANYMDLVLMECLERGKQINWPAFIIKLLDRVINGSKAHVTPYGFILTTVLDRLNVPLKWEMASSKEHFGIKTLLAYDYSVNAIPIEPGSSQKTPINSKVRTLVQECAAKDAEIAQLKARVVEVKTEKDGLRTQLAKKGEE
uniref:Uncharacterized protein n=1 Tax=Nicotiana tabacum TaxID=4097 RepID=A0A1S3XL61_TOBAC|nr:PREDICTED: uncharacterized protein LOC107766394 [Nicotiana tabacum]